MFLIATVGFVFVANAQQDKKSIQGLKEGLVEFKDPEFPIMLDNLERASHADIGINNNYNDQGSKLGGDCYTIPAAPAQGSHSETTKKLSKPVACRSATSGCEVKRIKITSAKVQN